MSNALVAKIKSFASLSESEVNLIERASAHTREIHAHQDLIREGDELESLMVILGGWACRYKILPQGTRQITAFLMPGDCCDTHISVLDVMDDTLATLTPCRVATISRARVDELITDRPVLSRAFQLAQLVHDETLKAWMVSLGRRDSIQRVAHLMCELHTRGSDVRLLDGNTLAMDLTHAYLGDALGLTAVHVCRVLRKLRVAGLMELRAGTLTVYDFDALAEIAGFDSSYLHQPSRQLSQQRSRHA